MGCFITIVVQHKKITKQVIMVAKTCLGDRACLEMVSKVVFWDSKHDRRKQGRPAMTYIDSLVKDTDLTVDELDTCTRN